MARVVERPDRSQLTPPRSSPSGKPGPSGPDGLAVLGLSEGEAVRWRSGRSGRWQTGRAMHRERDGSIGVTDGRGLARSLTVDCLEVRCAGPRGAPGWEPLTERASRTEQLRLL